ncbi:MAG: nucleotidyltransferase substrate binding protein, partial [Bdellovibrionaceae bacterium]|nr:nucleotidyltransferase substrate binding protein [Pseudobdellovibrionaceae bacterium]
AKVLGSSSTTARPVIREMAQNALIQNPELWFEFIDARNKSSHTYKESLAQEVYLTAEKFLAEGRKLLAELKTK